jgi:hypothetical protein
VLVHARDPSGPNPGRVHTNITINAFTHRNYQPIYKATIQVLCICASQDYTT